VNFRLIVKFTLLFRPRSIFLVTLLFNQREKKFEFIELFDLIKFHFILIIIGVRIATGPERIRSTPFSELRLMATSELHPIIYLLGQFATAISLTLVLASTQQEWIMETFATMYPFF